MTKTLQDIFWLLLKLEWVKKNTSKQQKLLISLLKQQKNNSLSKMHGYSVATLSFYKAICLTQKSLILMHCASSLNPLTNFFHYVLVRFISKENLGKMLKPYLANAAKNVTLLLAGFIWVTVI